MRILILSVLLLFAACNRWTERIPFLKSSPEEVVRTFIHLSAEAKSPKDKERIAMYTIGPMREAVDQISEEDFKSIYLEAKLKIVELKILETVAKTGEPGMTVTYEVTVDNQSGTEPTVEINTREADLQEAGGRWYVESVRLKGTDKLAFTRGMIF